MRRAARRRIGQRGHEFATSPQPVTFPVTASPGPRWQRKIVFKTADAIYPEHSISRRGAPAPAANRQLGFRFERKDLGNRDNHDMRAVPIGIHIVKCLEESNDDIDRERHREIGHHGIREIQRSAKPVKLPSAAPSRCRGPALVERSLAGLRVAGAQPVDRGQCPD